MQSAQVFGLFWAICNYFAVNVPIPVWALNGLPQNLLVLSLLAEHDCLILWLQCTYLVTLLDSYKAA